MAQYERSFRGNFPAALQFCHDTIQRGSSSITLEAESNWSKGDTRVAVRVYERYSIMGGNRVSLSLTLVSNQEDMFVSIITSGGSRAVLFKLNTWGEHAFLDTIQGPLEKYIASL